MKISELLDLFTEIPKPIDYIDKDHCEECNDHFNELSQYTSKSLPYSIIENPGWDPTCFLTPLGFRYYITGLIRLSNGHHEWIETLISRLTGYQRPGLNTNDLHIVSLVMLEWLKDSTIGTEDKILIKNYLSLKPIDSELISQ